MGHKKTGRKSGILPLITSNVRTQQIVSWHATAPFTKCYCQKALKINISCNGFKTRYFHYAKRNEITHIRGFQTKETPSAIKQRQIPKGFGGGGYEERVTHGEAIRELQQESNPRFHDRPTRRQYITAERLREV